MDEIQIFYDSLTFNIISSGIKQAITQRGPRALVCPPAVLAACKWLTSPPSAVFSPAPHHAAAERDGGGGQRRHDLLRGRR